MSISRFQYELAVSCRYLIMEIVIFFIIYMISQFVIRNTTLLCNKKEKFYLNLIYLGKYENLQMFRNCIF